MRNKTSVKQFQIQMKYLSVAFSMIYRHLSNLHKECMFKFILCNSKEICIQEVVWMYMCVHVFYSLLKNYTMM